MKVSLDHGKNRLGGDSCLVCGRVKKPGVWWSPDPRAYVCIDCRDAARSAQQGEKA